MEHRVGRDRIGNRGCLEPREYFPVVNPQRPEGLIRRPVDNSEPLERRDDVTWLDAGRRRLVREPVEIEPDRRLVLEDGAAASAMDDFLALVDAGDLKIDLLIVVRGQRNRHTRRVSEHDRLIPSDIAELNDRRR